MERSSIAKGWNRGNIKETFKFESYLVQCRRNGNQETSSFFLQEVLREFHITIFQITATVTTGQIFEPSRMSANNDRVKNSNTYLIEYEKFTTFATFYPRSYDCRIYVRPCFLGAPQPFSYLHSALTRPPCESYQGILWFSELRANMNVLLLDWIFVSLKTTAFPNVSHIRSHEWHWFRVHQNTFLILEVLVLPKWSIKNTSYTTSGLGNFKIYPSN